MKIENYCYSCFPIFSCDNVNSRYPITFFLFSKSFKMVLCIFWYKWVVCCYCYYQKKSIVFKQIKSYCMPLKHKFLCKIRMKMDILITRKCSLRGSGVWWSQDDLISNICWLGENNCGMDTAERTDRQTCWSK